MTKPETYEEELKTDTEQRMRTVPLDNLVKKELRFCRCKDTEKNVAKILSRYARKNFGVLNQGKARKIIHVLIMTNRNILDK